MKKLFLSLLCTLFLAACGSSEKNAITHFEDYQNRLGTVLKINNVQPIVINANNRMPTLVRKRNRQIQAPKNTLSLYEFIRLKNCPLKKLIANKNNQLGQHMQPTNGIIYEVEVRHAIDTCLPLQTNEKLIQLLVDAKKYKNDSAVSDFWKYSFGADWYASFTSHSSKSIEWNDENTLLANKQSLQSLNQVLLEALSDKQRSSTVKDYKQPLNQSIQTLENSAAFGKLMTSLISSTQALEQINTMLQQADKKKLCNKNMQGILTPNKQIDYLNNVVAQYFAKSIQIYLAKLSSDGGELLQEQKQLLNAFEKYHLLVSEEALPPAMKKLFTYHQESEKIFKKFNTTIKSHVAQIQKIQNICSTG